MRTLIVAHDLVDAIRAHAVEVHAERPGFESLGRLLVRDDGRAVEYLRLRNLADDPGKCRVGSSWRPTSGESSLLVHSHPLGAPRPSRADLAWAAAEERRRFGIFAHDQLVVFQLSPLTQVGYRPVLVKVRLGT